MNTYSPFSNFPLIKTGAIEEAEYQLSHSLTDLEILSAAERKQFHLRMNGVNLRRTSLIYNYFGSDTRIRSKTPGDSLLFIVGEGTPATFNMNGQSIIVSQREAAVVSPNHVVQVNRPKGSEVLVVKVSMEILNNQLHKLTDHYHKNPLLFSAGIRLDKGAGVRLKETLNLIIHEMENGQLLDKLPTLPDIYDHMILTALLELPHNHSDSICAYRNSFNVSAVVKIAEDFIADHVTDPITISDLLPVCRCSRRTLFHTFQVERGYSPMEFLIERRLQRAKKIFEEGYSSKSVASIALESGFTHLGRFSQVYKKRFGESPSVTIRRNS